MAKEELKHIFLSAVGSSVAGLFFMAVQQSLKGLVITGNGYKPIPQIYVEGDGECLPLTSFVEPHHPDIVSLASRWENLSDERFFTEAYNFVTSNIAYPSRGAEVFHKASEALALGSSGCFGSSVLLASLLRNRLSASDVYVALGKLSGGGGHAWVLFKDDGSWKIAETTSPQPLTWDEKYYDFILFNDRTILARDNWRTFLKEYLCASKVKGVYP